MALGDADAFSSVIMEKVADLSREVAENATEIAEAGLELTKSIMNEGSTTRFNLANVERDLQNRIFEARIESLKTSKDVNDRITEFERNTDMQFRDVLVSSEKNTQVILKQMAEDKAASLKDELDETRLELWNSRSVSNFALQNQEIANLKNMINSVEQTQKFSNKTVQFGAGNVAIPTQTANQG